MIMKNIFALILLWVIISTSANAQDKIAFRNKKSFHQNFEKTKFCSTFEITISSADKLIEFESHIKDNPSVYELIKDGSTYQLKVITENFDKVYYDKLFYSFANFEFEIVKGNSKGVYTMEQFFKLYGL